ncbi:unnamed protein product [Auanema sp. JU1783]|nr:unnamed protein product [Auanema sp. JU1783]
MITRVLTIVFAIHFIIFSLIICVKKKTKSRKHSKKADKRHARETNNMNSYSTNVSCEPEPVIPVIAPPPSGAEHVYEDIMVLDMLSPPQNGSVY